MVRPGEGAAHDLFEVEGTIGTDQARVMTRPDAAARGRWEWKHPGQALVSKRRARRVDVVGCRALGGVRERRKEELLASRRCHAPRARRGGRRALHPASRPPTARQEERPRQKLCTRVTARVRTKGSRRNICQQSDTAPKVTLSQQKLTSVISVHTPANTIPSLIPRSPVTLPPVPLRPAGRATLDASL